jgi:hypothetical protein
MEKFHEHDNEYFLQEGHLLTISIIINFQRLPLQNKVISEVLVLFIISRPKKLLWIFRIRKF